MAGTEGRSRAKRVRLRGGLVVGKWDGWRNENGNSKGFTPEQSGSALRGEAQNILGLIATKGAPGTGATMTRELVRARLAGKPAFRVPLANAEPFRKRKRIQCSGVPASEMLIADRR